SSLSSSLFRATPCSSCSLPSPHPPLLPFLSFIIPPPPTSTLFPYTTLFRSDFRTADGTGSMHDLLLGNFFAQTKVLAKKLPSNKDRKSTRLNSSHVSISYAVFCLKKKTIRH